MSDAATPTTPAATTSAKPPPSTLPAAAKPALPAKPPTAKPPAKDDRRWFLVRMLTDSVVMAWTAFTAAMVGMTLGTARFMFPNVLAEPPNKVKVGEPSNFEDGKVVEAFKDRAIWMVRYQGKIFALNTMCTHLGCTPNWLEADKKFKCPCHGSGFYITGVNFEGPAPRPLERWAIGFEEGQLVVDKSKKFQKEQGQWDNPESFYPVV